MGMGMGPRMRMGMAEIEDGEGVENEDGGGVENETLQELQTNLLEAPTEAVWGQQRMCGSYLRSLSWYFYSIHSLGSGGYRRQVL